MTYSHQAQAEPVSMCDKIHVTLFCSVPNSDGRPLIYRIQEWINISVSSRFPEKGRGGTIFRSLKEDQAGGVWGRELVMVKSEVGSGVDESLMVEEESDKGEVVGGKTVEA